MDSGLSERLIRVAPPPPPPPLSNRYDQQAPAAIINLKKLRVAVLTVFAGCRFIKGIDNLDSQDEEQIETTEEANVPSRYYCYQCRQVVSVTVDVEITCPLCHDGWIQKCGGISLLYLAMPSESEHSASDSDGQGTILDLDSLDEEQTETTEEANVPSRYYCYQCRQVVSVTVDVEITCPLCHDGWIQKCGGISLLYLAMPSESEHSASDSDGQDTILDLDSQDEEQTETTEEANVPSRYYCYQCCQVFSVTVDVEITCPLCDDGWIQECGSVSLLYLTMPSESEHSASDSDGQGNILIHPSSQTVIVEDSYGSDANPNRFPFHSTGSHDYDNYVESHQATGHYDSSLEQGLLTLGIDGDVIANQPPHGVTTSVWIFSVTGLAFEAVSALFDQVSTPQNPQYSLYGMLLSIVAVPVCIWDLIYNAQIQRKRGLTSAGNILWGILPEIFGLALACIQCISSALQFSFLCRHAANPMKISLVPFLFFFALFAFKYREVRIRG